jgi:hypothetical protein
VTLLNLDKVDRQRASELGAYAAVLGFGCANKGERLRRDPETRIRLEFERLRRNLSERKTSLAEARQGGGQAAIFGCRKQPPLEAIGDLVNLLAGQLQSGRRAEAFA